MATVRALAARLIHVSRSIEDRSARAGSTPLRSRRGLPLRLEDETGCWGQGEASPLPDYSPDTIEACRAELEAADWREVRSFEDESPAKALLAEVSGQLGLRAAAARFAVETALLDLLGR